MRQKVISVESSQCIVFEDCYFKKNSYCTYADSCWSRNKENIINVMLACLIPSHASDCISVKLGRILNTAKFCSSSQSDGWNRKLEIVIDSSPPNQLALLIFESEERKLRKCSLFCRPKLAGKIVLELLEATNVNEILIELRGSAKTYWTKHSGGSRKHYRDTEPYFCEQFNTNYTKPNRLGGKDIPLGKGKHEIPFFYRLPENLPSSFEGDFGYARYTCKATIERPWESDLICKRAFTVVGDENLPEEKSCLNEMKITESASSLRCCLFSRRDQIHVRMSLPKTYFVPGEVIRTYLQITNDSRRTLKNCHLTIVQHICYKAKDFSCKEHRKRTDKAVLSESLPVIGKQQQVEWIRPLIVPSIPPKLTRCTIIEITYSCNLKIDSHAFTPIAFTVGSITPKKLMRNSLTKAVENVSTKLADTSQTFQAYGRWADQIVYNEAIIGEALIQETIDALQYCNSIFKPKYPCLLTSAELAEDNNNNNSSSFCKNSSSLNDNSVAQHGTFEMV
ncbi:Arrestin domain-containing protein [Trichinella spiralis]|uniref:Arrestin domain-containing protein n=1 Tax=Trichinella spiralis TaxID=6334 RepID=A0ABR3KUW8_TRISP